MLGIRYKYIIYPFGPMVNKTPSIEMERVYGGAKQPGREEENYSVVAEVPGSSAQPSSPALIPTKSYVSVARSLAPTEPDL